MLDSNNRKSFRMILKYAKEHPDEYLYATDVSKIDPQNQITKQGWSYCFHRLCDLGYLEPCGRTFHGKAYRLKENPSELVKHDIEAID